MRQCAMPAQADITTAPARGPFGRSPMDFRNSTQVTRMISRASAAALSRIAGPVAILSCLVLASCGGPVSENMPRANAVGDRLGGMFEPRQRELPKPDPTQQALGEIPYCPEAQILDGTELFRDYVRGSEGDEQAITMQASVTETARELSAERLGERLDAHDAPAEVRDHVEALNGMLARLETAFQRLSDYSADIAHELRTPISNLMTQTQVALSRPRTSAEYQDILASNLEEYERIARTLGDMLFLAKAEENTLAHAGEVVDLASEVDALIDFYEALAEERRVRILRQGRASVHGDRLMLRRALSNLISNALRHTPDGERITIAIEADTTAIRLVVCNPGAPIPADQIERIFERFHRASAQRETRGEGAGLGLAITRSIVRAHGGEIAARSAEGLTRFTMTLPR